MDNHVDKSGHNGVTPCTVRAFRPSVPAVCAVLGGNIAPQIFERTADGKLWARTFEHSFVHYFGTAKRNDAPRGKNARRELRPRLLRIFRNRNVMSINAYGRQIKIAQFSGRERRRKSRRRPRGPIEMDVKRDGWARKRTVGFSPAHSSVARYFSASRAAEQPEPAAVMAWR